MKQCSPFRQIKSAFIDDYKINRLNTQYINDKNKITLLFATLSDRGFL